MISSLPTPKELEALRTALKTTSLPIELPGSEDARRDRAELLDQIDDYLLPRLRRIDAPLLAVLGGSTGAGKSTMTNSIVGSEVTKSGVLRPTTRAPVLVCHPDDLAWFSDPTGILPELSRTMSSGDVGQSSLRLAPIPNLPKGLALLDAPDIDSIEVANHDLAAQLLGAADLWIFVTTAARYADAVPWEYLAKAQERSVALAVVINRIPSGHEPEVVEHFSEMLRDRGLTETTVFSISERELVDDRLGDGVEPIQQWLRDISSTSDHRQALVRKTLVGALASLPPRIHRISAAVDQQAEQLQGLKKIAEDRYGQAMVDINLELDRGTLLRGEVLEQWREFVGTGAIMSRLEAGVGRIRDGLKNLIRSPESPDAQAAGQLESNLLIVTRDAVDRAALDVVEQWESRPGGKQILAESSREISRADRGLTSRIEHELSAWEQEVLDLVRNQAGDKVAIARTVSTGINGVGVALMIAVFSQSAGITGAEAAIATGTAAVSQTVLTAVFGEQAVRDLANEARNRLNVRLTRILEEDRSRFDQLIGSQITTSRNLNQALATLENS